MIRNLEETGVSSNSWGFPDNGFPYSAPDTWLGSIERGLAEGYGGKGISYVWAAGNGGAETDDSNLDGRANHHGVIAACAIDYGDTRSYYSEPGANLWVCAPSSGGEAAPRIATTTNGGYRTDFGGTSAAAPIVSGVVALMRSVNPALTWRDVKLILAASARKNDPGNSGWEEGALRYGSTTARYSFNHEYGFGMVDAAAAVDLADGWTNAPAMRTTTARYQGESFSIPDAPQVGSSRTITTTLTVDEYVEFAEFVEIKIAIDHASFRDLEIDLVSPSGATSRLATEGRVYSFFFAFPALLNETFRMGSARHLGEDPAGEWQLRVTDRVTGRTGRIDWWSLTIYGHGSAPGYPEIGSLATGERSLMIDWKAPADIGASDITSYDLRHIPSTASDLDRGGRHLADRQSDLHAHRPGSRRLVRRSGPRSQRQRRGPLVRYREQGHGGGKAGSARHHPGRAALSGAGGRVARTRLHRRRPFRPTICAISAATPLTRMSTRAGPTHSIRRV